MEQGKPIPYRRKPRIVENFELGKIPPQNIELEMNVLGTVIYNFEEKEVQRTIPHVHAEQFYKESHQIIWNAIKRLIDKEIPVDSLTLTEELNKSGELETVGGIAYLTMLSNHYAYNIFHHHLIVYEKFVLRELIRVSSQLTKDAYEETTDCFDLLDKYIEELDNRRPQMVFKPISKGNDVANSMQEELTEAFNSGNIILSYDIGHKQFDKMVTIGRDKIMLIAGPKGGLKSRFTNHIVTRLLERYKDVSVFWVSLEDSAKDLIWTYISSKVHVKPKYLKARRFPKSLLPEVNKWLDVWRGFDVVIRDQSCKINDILVQASHFCHERKERFNIIIIDNVLSLQDRDDFKHDLNAMYDFVYSKILDLRQRTHALIIPVHHYKKDQMNKTGLNIGYRPSDEDLKGTEAGARVANQTLLTNFPRIYKDLMAQYVGNDDAYDVLSQMFIVDTGKNREDENTDEVSLIHYLVQPNYNLFVEVDKSEEARTPPKINPHEVPF